MQRRIIYLPCVKSNILQRRFFSDFIEDDFRVLNLRPVQNNIQKIKRQKKLEPATIPRASKMSVTQDWTSVWPHPRSFHPASVPLPLRQGFNEKGAPPSKFANAELMKIPNFLHLTPSAIKQQCEALKKFCTPWPHDLTNEIQSKKYFPLEIISSDYCHGLPTIRNNLARIVTLKIDLSSLYFDEHAKDKFLRIVGENYNPETNIITITSDRCPVRKQNFNFCLYILTASYFESFVTEPWEDLKAEKDMVEYDFSQNKSKQTIQKLIALIRKNDPVIVPKITKDLSTSVEKLFNEVECKENIESYKKQIKNLLGL